MSDLESLAQQLAQVRSQLADAKNAEEQAEVVAQATPEGKAWGDAITTRKELAEAEKGIKKELSDAMLVIHHETEQNDWEETDIYVAFNLVVAFLWCALLYWMLYVI